MEPADLHCTSHISLGPDNDQEKKWFCTPFEKYVRLLYFGIYKLQQWLSLTPEQLDFFNVRGTRPHISLAKPTHWQWQGV